MARKLLYVGNDAGYFMAHRHNLAAAAMAAGWAVHVASPAGPDDDLVLVRVTASSGESGPEAGSSEWLSMRTLFEYGCERTVWEDEEERARREAADRREVAERERMLEAARERGRQRHHGRSEDRDISW